MLASGSESAKDEALPPDPEKLSLEVGTPWVDRVYDRKSVPGFFVIFWNLPKPLG